MVVKGTKPALEMAAGALFRAASCISVTLSSQLGLSPSRSCAPAIGLGRLVSGHSAQYLSAMTPMAKPRNNKKNAHIQFGSNGTT
jgi:hypothetical protein